MDDPKASRKTRQRGSKREIGSAKGGRTLLWLEFQRSGECRAFYQRQGRLIKALFERWLRKHP